MKSSGFESQIFKLIFTEKKFQDAEHFLLILFQLSCVHAFNLSPTFQTYSYYNSIHITYTGQSAEISQTFHFLHG